MVSAMVGGRRGKGNKRLDGDLLQPVTEGS